jgi:ferredoxin
MGPVRESSAPLEVQVDRDVCSGSGLCVRICPEVFELLDGYSTVMREGITDDTVARVEEAVRLCPLEALSITRGGPDRA